MALQSRTRVVQTALLGLIILAPQQAQAQLRFVPLGMGGASTPQGDMMRGGGMYMLGAGEFVRNTAVAESIHVDNWIRMQQYLAVSRYEQMQRLNAMLQRRKENRNQAISAIRKRLRENPTESDLMNGDALNVLLEDLTDPKVSPSELMRTKVPISVSFVQQVPFQFPTLGGSISMRILTARDGWPLSLRSDAFLLERKAYARAIDRVLEQISQGKLMPDTVDRLKQAIIHFQTKVDEVIPQADLKTYLQAKNFIKDLGDAAQMLESQSVERVIAQLEKYPGTTIAELLEFMIANNLQFSPAETATERELYRQLYPLLRRQKDRMGAAPPSDDLPINPERNVGIEVGGARDPVPPRPAAEPPPR